MASKPARRQLRALTQTDPDSVPIHHSSPVLLDLGLSPYKSQHANLENLKRLLFITQFDLDKHLLLNLQYLQSVACNETAPELFEEEVTMDRRITVCTRMIDIVARWNNDAIKIKIKLPIPRIIGWAKDLLFRSNKTEFQLIALSTLTSIVPYLYSSAEHISGIIRETIQHISSASYLELPLLALIDSLPRSIAEEDIFVFILSSNTDSALKVLQSRLPCGRMPLIHDHLLKALLNQPSATCFETTLASIITAEHIASNVASAFVNIARKHLYSHVAAIRRSSSDIILALIHGFGGRGMFMRGATNTIQGSEPFTSNGNKRKRDEEDGNPADHIRKLVMEEPFSIRKIEVASEILPVSNEEDISNPTVSKIASTTPLSLSDGNTGILNSLSHVGNVRGKSPDTKTAAQHTLSVLGVSVSVTAPAHAPLDSTNMAKSGHVETANANGVALDVDAVEDLDLEIFESDDEPDDKRPGPNGDI